MSDLPAALSFLGVQEPIERAAVVVLPVPYDLTTTYQPGARFGPRALLTASLNVELFDEELRWDPSRVGIHTLEPLEPLAVGPQAMVPLIREQVEEIFLAGKFPIVLGGDHSVSIGALEALARRWENPWVLQIDAHADLREEYQGSPFSHACVMARARESFPCVQVGVRSWSAEEDAALWERPERVILAREAEEDPEAAAERLLSVLGDPVYLTIDLDGLDPSILPATGTPEPGGLRWFTLTHLLRRVAESRHVVGCDVTELSPIPGFIAPDFLAARLVLKVISYVFHRRHQGGG
ncbi:MAG: agmatinase [Candidatus Eisenbacteria bacterium]|uniref:Agmatinase n=1 Tax=Eiseniibacteriota bacterium TaxID=2212470 RepID=A0A937X8Y2_UNCEI|nr:agmatinase [Candidatus Eisenbacteria bacterium]